jgi:MFS family permease
VSLVDKGAIALTLLILTCGQILWWRRRDNIAAYVAGGLFFASVFVPVFFTGALDAIDVDIARHYSRILAVGAAAYLAGLFLGAPHGVRCRRPPATFDRPFAGGFPPKLIRRARVAAACALVTLAGSFVLMGYVPLLAGDRHLAKYGVGPYAAGFSRASLFYHVALAVATAIAPVMLMIAYRHRRGIDFAICLGIIGALGLTLSRGSVFAGPLLFLVALAVERRWSPSVILAGVCLAFVGGSLVNELLYDAPPTARPPLPVRIAASAPDISEHLLFVSGFQLAGEEFVGTKTLTAGFNLARDKGAYNPAYYAVRTITGLTDVKDLASGGARLPAPLWGYSAFGYVGAVIWPLMSGIAVGFGTTLFRRLLTDVQGVPGQGGNLVLAHLAFAGTFGVLGTFYFPQRIGVVLLALALALGLGRRQVVGAEELRRHASVA